LKPLNRYFGAIARPSLERYGFAYAELLRNWAAIAPDAARFARPESLHFPRRAGKGKGMGAHLRLRVQPGRALEMQHMQGEIIERINAYFGYGAVEKLTFLQAPLEDAERPHEPPPPAPDPAARERLLRRARKIADADLRESLARLAEGVSVKRP